MSVPPPEEAFPPLLPLDIHQLSAGFPQGFQQAEIRQILGISGGSAQELDMVFVWNISNLLEVDFQQLFRRK